MIHVCSLARLHSTVKKTGARHIVTLLGLEDRIDRPETVPARVLRSVEAGDAAVVHVNAMREPDQDPDLSRASSWRRLKRFPAKACPGLDPGWRPAATAALFAGHDCIDRCRYWMRVAEGADRCVRDRFPATPTVSLVDHVASFPAELRW